VVIGILKLEIRLPFANSLKDKRRLIKSLIAHLRNDFNVSVSEIGYQDYWRKSLIGIGIVTNETKFAHRILFKITEYIKNNKELSVIDSKMEIM